MNRINRWKRSGKIFPEAVRNRSEHCQDKNVSRNGKKFSRFFNAPKICPRKKPDDDDADKNTVGIESGNSRRDRGNPRNNRDRCGQDVVDDEGRGTYECRGLSQILFCDVIDTSALRVGENCLPI